MQEHALLFYYFLKNYVTSSPSNNSFLFPALESEFRPLHGAHPLSILPRHQPCLHRSLRDDTWIELEDIADIDIESSLKCYYRSVQLIPAILWPSVEEWSQIFVAESCCSMNSDDTLLHLHISSAKWSWIPNLFMLAVLRRFFCGTMFCCYQLIPTRPPRKKVDEPPAVVCILHSFLLRSCLFFFSAAELLNLRYFLG